MYTRSALAAAPRRPTTIVRFTHRRARAQALTAAVGGDPRRPDDAQRPPKPVQEDEIDIMLVISMMVGLGGFMLKVRLWAHAWGTRARATSDELSSSVRGCALQPQPSGLRSTLGCPRATRGPHAAVSSCLITTQSTSPPTPHHHPLNMHFCHRQNQRPPRPPPAAAAAPPCHAQHTLMAWVALLVAIVGIANLKSTAGMQHVVSAAVFSVVGLIGCYTHQGPRGYAAIFPPKPAAA